MNELAFLPATERARLVRERHISLRLRVGRPVPRRRTGAPVRGGDRRWEQFDRAARFTPFTASFNVTGQSAVSAPLHWTDAGLPIGVQLVGPPLGDALLLRVASQLEAACPWATADSHIPEQKKDVRNGDTASRTPL